MSWLDASAYFELERANGIRFPPTTAALRTDVERVAGFGLAAIGTSGVENLFGWRYSEYAVLSVT
jgi:hypothetical protein